MCSYLSITIVTCIRSKAERGEQEKDWEKSRRRKKGVKRRKEGKERGTGKEVTPMKSMLSKNKRGYTHCSGSQFCISPTRQNIMKDDTELLVNIQIHKDHILRTESTI